MEKVFIGRKRCETVKSPKLMPSLIFSKVGQWTRFEFLLGQFWSSGLMFNTPVLEDDLMFHCSSFSLVVTLGEKSRNQQSIFLRP